MPGDFASVAINASSSSLPDLVENAAEEMLLLALDRSLDVIASVARAPNAGAVIKKTAKTTARWRLKMSTITLGEGAFDSTWALQILSIVIGSPWEIIFNGS